MYKILRFKNTLIIIIHIYIGKRHTPLYPDLLQVYEAEEEETVLNLMMPLGCREHDSARDHSHERGVSLVRVSPLSDWYVVQQRRVHGHFTRRTLIFRFKSMGEENWTAGQGHKGRICPL